MNKHSAVKEPLLAFLLSMMIFSLGRGMFHGIQDNFLAWLGVDKSGRGIVEFFRETPGLLLVFVLSLFYRMQERSILRIAILICIAGVIGMVMASSQILPAIFFFVLFNLGDHIIMPVRQSYAIHAAPRGQEGRTLGFLRSLIGIGQVLGMALVSLTFFLPAIKMDRDNGGRLGYMIVQLASVVFFVVAIAMTLGIPKSQGALERKRVYFHSKFNKYYILEMFYGGRKQVFLTFAPYLLILQYNAKAEYIAALLGLCALVNIFFNPLLGRLVDRLGYRTVMIYDTLFLFVVCIIYGFAHRIFDHQTAFVVISISFLVDRMLSNAAIANSVYASRMSENRQEVTSTLSTGLSVNHFVTVFIALIGGFVWEKLGVEALFSIAALMALLNSLFAVTVKESILT